MRLSNVEYFKDFKIFDLTWIWWIWLKWSNGHTDGKLFNLDITKQAQEVIFSRKNTKSDHPIVYFNEAHPIAYFNEAPVVHTTCQKHLGMYLDEKLNFNYHVKEKIAMANKGIGLSRKLAHVFPRQSLLTIYKSFIRPHLDYGDIIYDQPNYESFCNLIRLFGVCNAIL